MLRGSKPELTAPGHDIAPSSAPYPHARGQQARTPHFSQNAFLSETPTPLSSQSPWGHQTHYENHKLHLYVNLAIVQNVYENAVGIIYERERAILETFQSFRFPIRGSIASPTCRSDHTHKFQPSSPTCATLI